MKISESLTWDELADIYDKMTGGCARIKIMDQIFNWAEKQKKVFVVDKDGYLHQIISDEDDGM